ncbi:MAG: hypothetical protein JXR94_19140, partial [Candidatus Hydrogenedentes bacterium]|nr:hypothetical protein [Candidatus Hydrogenedentota bacterium]
MSSDAPQPGPPAARSPLRWLAAKALAVTAIVMAAIYLLSGITVIKPEEQALVLRLGKAMAVPLLPGTHYTLPYPMDRILVYKPSEVKDVTVGVAKVYDDRPADRDSASRRGVNVGPEFLTGDENIIHIKLNVQYQIGDASAYLLRSVDTDRLVVVACDEALTEHVAQTPVDSILTSGRQPLLAAV